MTGGFDAWIGRIEVADDRLTLSQMRQLAATLDMDATQQAAAGIVEGGVVPTLWHWIAWTPDAPMSRLGADGHPERGGFLPPVPLERRMWAGGRLTFHAPLRIGALMRRRSEIIRISEKTGATGPMVFVTVRHEISTETATAITEEQDIVYVSMPERFTPPPPVSLPEGAAWSEPVQIDTARLFRFSAVTFNAHRIHYDLDYAQHVEKYPGLVVHGPLQAMLLMEAARRRRDGAQPQGYRFRGVRPLFHFNALRLVGQTERDGAQALFTATGDDLVCMQAEVAW